MKRIICALLSLLMVMSLFVGCSSTDSQETPNKDNNQSQTESSKPATSSTNSTNGTTNEEKPEMKSIIAPITGVWVQCRAERKVRESGNARIVASGNNTLVAYCMGIVDPYSGDLEGVFDFFKESFPANAASNCQGDISSSVIELIESKKVTMAGFDSIRFTGKVANKSGWDCHVYGYTFLIDGVPYAVIGIVSDATQSADLIAYNQTEVDEIAATIKKGS